MQGNPHNREEALQSLLRYIPSRFADSYKNLQPAARRALFFCIALVLAVLLLSAWQIRARSSRPSPAQLDISSSAAEIKISSRVSTGKVGAENMTPPPQYTEENRSDSSVSLTINGQVVPIPKNGEYHEDGTDISIDGDQSSAKIDVSIDSSSIEVSNSGERTKFRLDVDSSIESEVDIEKEVKTRD